MKRSRKKKLITESTEPLSTSDVQETPTETDTETTPVSGPVELLQNDAPVMSESERNYIDRQIEVALYGRENPDRYDRGRAILKERIKQI